MTCYNTLTACIDTYEGAYPAAHSHVALSTVATSPSPSKEHVYMVGTLLQNVSVVLMSQQVLQPLLLHGLFPFVLVPVVMETDIFIFHFCYSCLLEEEKDSYKCSQLHLFRYS